MSMSKYNLAKELYRGDDPFSFYHASQENVDMQGWRSNHPYLYECVEKLKPSKIVEIGVWKGGSVITLANALQTNNIDGVVLCVDTFRGSPEHWCEEKLFKLMNFKNGSPGIYDNFMSNIASKSLQEYVLPFPVDSITAYEVCKRKQIKFDLIHIDAGHEYESVKRDLENWSTLANPHAAIIMDDYCWDDEKNISTAWHGVAKTVNEFVEGNKNKIDSFNHHRGKCTIKFK